MTDHNLWMTSSISGPHVDMYLSSWPAAGSLAQTCVIFLSFILKSIALDLSSFAYYGYCSRRVSIVGWYGGGEDYHCSIMKMINDFYIRSVIGHRLYLALTIYSILPPLTLLMFEYEISISLFFIMEKAMSFDS